MEILAVAPNYASGSQIAVALAGPKIYHLRMNLDKVRP